MNKTFFSSLIVIIFLIFCSPSHAKNLSIIRDAETENFLVDLTRPIFEAAGLNPNDIKIYIVNDSSLNAFVSAGQNIFIHTGLLTKYNKPDVLIGVIAHEAAHIASGHLARSSEKMKDARNAMFLTYLVGIAAAVSGGADAGSALILGGNQVMERLVLKYSREQEEAADALALKYLDKINYPAFGLLELLKFFNDEESAFIKLIDEYTLTHPVSEKRINFIKANIGKNRNYNNKINRDLEPRMRRIAVKLESFLDDPDKTLEKYSKQNNFLSKYAKSIAYFKKGKIKESLFEIDDLLKLEPDGYLWELKGQILFESGLIKESIVAYKQALSLSKSNSALIRIAFANSIISLNSGDKDLADTAINNLQIALTEEKDNAEIFKQLASSYNQNNDLGRAYLALAEFNLLRQDQDKAIKYAKLAKEKLDKDDRSSLIKADDILAASKKKD